MKPSLVNVGQSDHPEIVPDGSDTISSERSVLFASLLTTKHDGRQHDTAAAPARMARGVPLCDPAFAAIEMPPVPGRTGLHATETRIRDLRRSGRFVIGITAGATANGRHSVAPTTILALLKAGLHCHIASEAMSPAELHRYVAAIAPRPRETQLVCFDARDFAAISRGRLGRHFRLSSDHTAAEVAARLTQQAATHPVAAFVDLRADHLSVVDTFISAMRAGLWQAGADNIDIVFAATTPASRGGMFGEVILFAAPDRLSRWRQQRKNAA